MLKTPAVVGISMVSQKNRRWLVAFTYSVLIFFMTLLILIQPFDHLFFKASMLIGVVISRLILGRLVKERAFSETRRGQMTVLDLLPGRRDKGHLDEREVMLSNAAHYEAFRVLAYFSLFIFIALPILTELDVPSLIRALEGISAALLILFFTLPQAMLLWSEPDVPEEVRI